MAILSGGCITFGAVLIRALTFGKVFLKAHAIVVRGELLMRGARAVFLVRSTHEVAAPSEMRRLGQKSHELVIGDNHNKAQECTVTAEPILGEVRGITLNRSAG